MASLSSSTVQQLQQVVDGFSDKQNGIPGSVVVVVGKDGKELFAHASGKRGHITDEPMNLDHVFWIASCTKMITGIACMQLVEKNVLSLDDTSQVEKLCPELRNVKVLDKSGQLVERNKPITLRMLLAHTAGFGYTFFHEGLRDHSWPAGYDEFSGHLSDLIQPLVHQPGESWQYGVNIDWAGIMVERATGLTLNQYMTQYIFQPLGLHNISLLPTESMKQHLAYMNYRAPDGKLSGRDHLLRRPLIVTEGEDCVQSGGAGCFAKPQEYCQIIATLLNDGTSPTTGARILTKATVDEMFRNQIPEFPNFGTNGIPAAKPDLTNPIPALYPVSEEVKQGWGLTFMLTGGSTGRSPGTGHWAGLPNLWWWADRTNGVGGMICTQILPFVDLDVLNLWFAVESGVYQGLK